MKIIIGQKFGRLTTINEANNIIGKSREYGAWECKCECGNTKTVASYQLNRGSVKSCGCIRTEGNTSLKVGQKFGKLILIFYKNGKWTCLCECGEHTSVASSQLKSGNTKSCGCFKILVSSNKSDKLIAGRRKFDPKIASARRIWKSYGYRDKKLTITFEEFLIISQKNCNYCGTIPNTKYNYFLTRSSNSSDMAKKEGLFIYNGMDRINSSKFHTIDNIVACCSICNRAKNDRSVEDFLEWINNLRIINFNPININYINFPSNNSIATSIKCVFYNYKKDTDLSVKEYYSISQLNCFYCDHAPSNNFNRAKTDKKSSKKAKQNGNYIYNGIDRIDCSKPHNKNNIVPCCRYCNFAKNKLSLIEFQNWISKIQAYQKEKAQL